MAPVFSNICFWPSVDGGFSHWCSIFGESIRSVLSRRGHEWGTNQETERVLSGRNKKYYEVDTRHEKNKNLFEEKFISCTFLPHNEPQKVHFCSPFPSMGSFSVLKLTFESNFRFFKKWILVLKMTPWTEINFEIELLEVHYGDPV